MAGTSEKALDSKTGQAPRTRVYELAQPIKRSPRVLRSFTRRRIKMLKGYKCHFHSGCINSY
jgi:hypothetical protein